MLSFGLGTLPKLLAMGLFAARLSRLVRNPWTRRLAGVRARAPWRRGSASLLLAGALFFLLLFLGLLLGQQGNGAIEADFEHVFRHSSFEYRLKPAVGNKFSDKISNAVDNIFSDGTRKLIYLDVDAALVSLQTVRHCYELLSLDDDVVVLGPDEGDQLYMVGLKKPHVQIFDAINSKDPFEVSMKISAPLASMLFTLERFYCRRDLTGPRRVFTTFTKNGQFNEQARRTTDFLLGLKDKYSEI